MDINPENDEIFLTEYDIKNTLTRHKLGLAGQYYANKIKQNMITAAKVAIRNKVMIVDIAIPELVWRATATFEFSNDCYAAHNLSLAMQMMSRRYNDRTVEYGGSLENRVRLFREIIEDTKDAIGDTCAVVLRFAVDEMMGKYGITSAGEDGILWQCSQNYLIYGTLILVNGLMIQELQDLIRRVFRKPVVGVGRYTSPDTMVSVIRRGVVDMIGAARPSIADPFLPKNYTREELGIFGSVLAVISASVLIC